MENPFEEARDILLEMSRKLKSLRFDDILILILEQYLPFKQWASNQINPSLKQKSISICITGRINTLLNKRCLSLLTFFKKKTLMKTFVSIKIQISLL